MNKRLIIIPVDRYTILACLIMLLMTSHLSNKIWVADFWEHAAAVRELATHPSSPQHSMLLVDKPHAFYSPYALVVAIFSRITRLGQIESLAIAGFINLLLLLSSLRYFVSAYVGKDAGRTAFYTLLFMLFLWGANPWNWSGYLHMKVLGYVLPYPSTFSAALLLFSLGTYLHILKGARLILFVVLFLTLPTILLTHPTTALVLYLGLIALTIGLRKAATLNVLLLLASAFTLSFIVAILYPYYSFIDLFLTKGREFHDTSRELYERVLPTIMPSLAGIVPLLSRFKKDRLDPLVLLLVFLTCIYIYGALSGSYAYGRVLFYIALLLQFALAMWVTKAEKHNNWKACALLVLYICLTVPFSNSLSSVTQYRPGRSSNYSDLLFLKQYTGQYDVILSDIKTSLIVPSFGGKVVAYYRPMYWVENETRKEDVNYFFSDKASGEDRLNILRRYRVNYILVGMETNGDLRYKLKPLLALGKVVYRSPAYWLIKIDQGDGLRTSV